MASTAVDVLNPYTPMAWVPPDVASRLIFQSYVGIGSLAGLLWDILLFSPQNYKVLRKNRFTPSTAVYILARLSALAYVLGIVITETAPISDCDIIRKISFLYPFALPPTVLLIVLRTLYLFKYKPFTVVFFSLSWVALLASSITVPFGVSGVQIGETQYCLEVMSKPQSTIIVVTPLVHNTLLYFATAWVFMKASCSIRKEKEKIDRIVLKENLPALCKSFLRNGQFYFLITIIMNIVFAGFALSSQTLITPFTLSLPTFVLINTMASHIYRNESLRRYSCEFTEHSEESKERRSSSGQQRMGIAFEPMGTRPSVRLTVDLEAARQNSDFDSQKKAEVAEFDNVFSENSKEKMAEKWEV